MRPIGLLVVLLTAVSLHGAVFVVPPDAELAKQSAAIVIARAGDSNGRSSAGLIETVTALEVERSIRGPLRPGETFEVVEIGGVADGLGLAVSGAARFTEGERVLLFLMRDRDGNWRTRDHVLGKFSFEGDTVVRRGVCGFDSDGGAHREPLRSASRFLRFLEATVRGEDPVPDYAVTRRAAADSLPPEIHAAPVSTYVLQSDGDAGRLGIRWSSFPSPVVFRSTGTQPGALGGGVTGVQRGMSAWTGDGGSNVIYQYGGVGGGASAFLRSDGINSVIFNDAGNDIPGAFTGSGTLAIGGAWFATRGPGATHTFAGEQFYTIQEADLAIQDGLTAPGVSGPGFDHVVTHELGHTLGFRHSDEPPAGGTVSTTALMNSSVDFHNDRQGSTLQAWDIEAVSTVYASGGAPPCASPLISDQPPSLDLVAGPVTMTVAAIGTGPFSYQWYVGSRGDTRNPIGGATGPAVSVQPAQTTSYWVRVSGQCPPPADSQTATVTVNGCPAIRVETPPADTTIIQGRTATLTVGVNGSGRTLNVQWFQGERGDTSRPAGTGTAINVAPATTTKYWIQITNDCGATMTTDAVTVTVTPCTAPHVLVQPASSEVIAGTSAALSATVAGTQPMLLQWYEGASGDTSRPVPNATTASVASPLIFAPSTFWLLVRNDCGEIRTDAARISIVASCTAPVITAQPQPQTVPPGSSTILTVSATGPSLSYRWYRGPLFDFSHPLAGNSPSVATGPVTEPTQFWVRIENPCGTAQSVAVTVSPGGSRRRVAGK